MIAVLRLAAYGRAPLAVVLVLLWSAGAASAKAGPDSFADLAAKLLPAVVNISTAQTIANKDDKPGSVAACAGR